MSAAAAVLLALAAGVPGYFIGPNSAFAAVVALFLIASGVIRGAAWHVYAGLATGQALACGLVLAGVLPDLALVPVFVGDHAAWEMAAAHWFLQLVFLGSFLAGRALERRYRDLVRQIDDATRAASRREALLEEARAEYRRALEVGRRSAVMAASQPLAVLPARSAPDARIDLARSGRLDAAELRALAADVAAALDALHARGGVHLDVRPRTIGRAAGGWQLADGSEAALDPGSDPSALLAYAAPERLHGEHAGASADVYGLAASLYAAATGRAPFDAGAAVLRAGGRPSPPRDPRPEISADVAAVLRIGMANAPEDRFRSAGELGGAFVDALEGRLDESVRRSAAALAARDPWEAPVDAAVSEVPGPAVAAPAITSPSSAGAWDSAYLAMVLGLAVSVTALCAAGGLFLAILADDRDLLRFAWGCLAGLVAGAWWHWLRVRRRPDLVVTWPWVVAAGLTVGPAMTVGLHSGFAAIVAALVFAGGMFRGPVRSGARDRRLRLLVSIALTHSTAFALIAAGLIGDRATVPVFVGDISLFQAGLRHLLVIGLYAAAFAAGRIIDRRHQALSREVEAPRVRRRAARRSWPARARSSTAPSTAAGCSRACAWAPTRSAACSAAAGSARCTRRFTARPARWSRSSSSAASAPPRRGTRAACAARPTRSGGCTAGTSPASSTAATWTARSRSWRWSSSRGRLWPRSCERVPRSIARPCSSWCATSPPGWATSTGPACSTWTSSRATSSAARTAGGWSTSAPPSWSAAMFRWSPGRRLTCRRSRRSARGSTRARTCTASRSSSTAR